jgi:hypothetical protein
VDAAPNSAGETLMIVDFNHSRRLDMLVRSHNLEEISDTRRLCARLWVGFTRDHGQTNKVPLPPTEIARAGNERNPLIEASKLDAKPTFFFAGHVGANRHWRPHAMSALWFISGQGGMSALPPRKTSPAQPGWSTQTIGRPDFFALMFADKSPWRALGSAGGAMSYCRRRGRAHH